MHACRHGAVFPGADGSKSAALLIRPSPPHYLLWGDTDIRIANSTNLTSWPDQGQILLSPRNERCINSQSCNTCEASLECVLSFFDTQLVESGPNPMLLSTGDYLFIYNSANDSHACVTSITIFNAHIN